MSALSLAVLLSSIRSQVSDDGADHLVVDGQLSGDQDGTNARFTVGHHPVNATGFQVRVNGVLKTLTTHYTLDDDLGIVEFTAGNIPVAADIVRGTFTWFTYPDDTYYEFIANGGQFFGIPATGADPDDRAQAVLTALGDNFLNALRAYVKYQYMDRRASDWAVKFSSSAGGLSDGGVDDVGNKFRELARDALAAAKMLRDDAISAFGQRKEVAAAITVHSGQDHGPRR